MSRAPNYNHERKERDRIKAAKKAEKLAAKAAAKERPAPTDQSEAEGKDLTSVELPSKGSDAFSR